MNGILFDGRIDEWRDGRVNGEMEGEMDGEMDIFDQWNR